MSCNLAYFQWYAEKRYNKCQTDIISLYLKELCQILAFSEALFIIYPLDKVCYISYIATN